MTVSSGFTDRVPESKHRTSPNHLSDLGIANHAHAAIEIEDCIAPYVRASVEGDAGAVLRQTSRSDQGALP